MAVPSPAELRGLLLSEARRLGFSRARIATVPPNAPGGTAFAAMVHSSRTAEMDWMGRGMSPRLNPSELLPQASSVLVLGVNYRWPRPPDPGGLTGKVSCYAWGRDYHNLVSKRLRKLCASLRREGVASFWSVDARPLVERAWAQRAGLGYVGRNCMVIVPGEGSFLFLGAVLIDAPAVADPALSGGLLQHCGRCTRCHDICPTAAFTGDGQLDAALCISTLTIEHRSVIPPTLARQCGRWVFGCDLCQDVCPHNHRPPTSLELDFQPRDGHAWLDLEWVLSTQDDALEAALVGSPLRRPKAWGLKRNALVVLANLGRSEGIALAETAQSHPHPVVQAQARQTLRRLSLG